MHMLRIYKTIHVLLVAVILLFSNIASAAQAVSDFEITNYIFVSEKRVSRTVYEYAFKAEVTNHGSVDAKDVIGILTVNAEGTTVVDGEIQFGDVAAGSSVTSTTDTLAIQLDMTIPFAGTINWNLTSDLSVVDDPISPELEEYLESIESLDIAFEDIILPDGTNAKEFLEAQKKTKSKRDAADESPDTLKKTLIVNLYENASKLVNYSSSDWTQSSDCKPTGDSQKLDKDKPCHTHIAYSYGSKNYVIRQAAPSGWDDIKDERCDSGTLGCQSCIAEVHGLDCTGFILNVFQQADLAKSNEFPIGGAKKQADALDKALIGTHYDGKLHAEYLGELPITDWEAGDIAYYPSHGHIGIVLKDQSGTIGVYQCNGTSDSNKNKQAKCELNYDNSKRGARILNMAQAASHVLCHHSLL